MRVFLLVGFDEASALRQLKTISWQCLDTAVWKCKKMLEIAPVEPEEENGRGNRATRWVPRNKRTQLIAHSSNEPRIRRFVWVAMPPFYHWTDSEEENGHGNPYHPMSQTEGLNCPSDERKTSNRTIIWISTTPKTISTISISTPISYRQHKYPKSTKTNEQPAQPTNQTTLGNPFNQKSKIKKKTISKDNKTREEIQGKTKETSGNWIQYMYEALFPAGCIYPTGFSSSWF